LLNFNRYFCEVIVHFSLEVIAKVLDLLTDGKADALVRCILGLVFGGRGHPPCYGPSFLY